ncbi:hypothetical protein OXX69_002609 [Metschnikowia pulcherrima]
MGKPKYILLVRHGESEGNCDKLVNRHTPNHKICLTEQGHEQATQAGAVLKEFLSQLKEREKGEVNPRSVMFYTSPYLRARQTCEDIIKGIKDVPGVDYRVREETRMREQDFGNFQSTPEETEQIWEQRAHYGHFFFRIPHGESAADVYDRIASFNESLYRKFENDSFPNVLVLVTHGIWARVFLMKWFRWSYEEFESLRNIPHCQFLVMKQVANKAYQLKTPLRKWDDLPDSDVDEEVAKEFTQEVTFNTKSNMSHPEDLDISSILRAQRDAIKENRKKDQEIKQLYQQSMGKYSDCHRILGDNSVFNSRENVPLYVERNSDHSSIQS